MPDQATTVLGWLALGAFGVAAAALIALHVVPSDANPISDGTSAYALGRTALGYRIQVLASGAGGLLLASALVQRDVSIVAVVCLVAYGVTRIAIVAYPTDPRGAALTRTGRRHAMLAAVAFLGAALAAPVATATFDAGGAPFGPIALAAVAALTTITSLVSFAVAAMPRTLPYYGIAQRAFYVSAFAWFILVSAAVVLD